MITTIQLNENVKKMLDRMKTGRETYEEVILNLIRTLDENKRRQEELIIEGCKEMYKDNIEINKEWESTLLDGLDELDNDKWT